MVRRLATASGGLLVFFHAWLLGSQLWDGQLLEPGVALRWLVAAGLVASLAALKRRGGSLIWGRKAVSIWLLAALLHGPAMADSGQHHSSPALPEAVTALVQIAAASVALGLGLLALATFLARRSAPRSLRLRRPVTSRSGARGFRRLLDFAPRPPPATDIPAFV